MNVELNIKINPTKEAVKMTFLSMTGFSPNGGELEQSLIYANGTTYICTDSYETLKEKLGNA